MRDCNCFDRKLLFHGNAFETIDNYENLEICGTTDDQGLSLFDIYYIKLSKNHNSKMGSHLYIYIHFCLFPRIL